MRKMPVPSFGPVLDAVLTGMPREKIRCLGLAGHGEAKISTLLAQTALVFASQGYDVFYIAERDAVLARARLAALPDGRFASNIYVHDGAHSKSFMDALRKFPCRRIVIDNVLRRSFIPSDLYNWSGKKRRERRALVVQGSWFGVDDHCADVLLRLEKLDARTQDSRPGNVRASIDKNRYGPIYGTAIRRLLLSNEGLYLPLLESVA